MSNAAIFFYSEGFDTGRTKLMGRQAAGESFLRGFIRHAAADQLYFWNWGGEPLERLQAMVAGIQPTDRPIEWIRQTDFPRLGEPGCVFISAPANSSEAWNRRLFGANSYSICGLTHTISSAGSLDAIAGLLTSPVEPWDALICTSKAVRDSAAYQLEASFDYLRERLGPVTPPTIRLETIPLGVNAEDFARSDAHRARWRSELGIPDDALVVLYVGRFSPHAKMNPLPMARAMERAARRTKREIHWVMSGWAFNEHLHASVTQGAARYAPSVKLHVLDGRDPAVRFSIWSAGDIFFSLSDNIQETFGLTPVEAMAAGLPSVISDWDGYRDTVRHGIDGFRIPTFAPRPGLGHDLAVQFGNEWTNYDHYIGRTSQFISVDLDATAEALLTLFQNDGLRASMGAAALERARTVFDWRTVIAQYEALWGELAAIRKAAPPKPPAGYNPGRSDPYALFSAYPTRALGAGDVVTLAPGVDLQAAAAKARDPSIAYASPILPKAEDMVTMLAALAGGPATVAEIKRHFPVSRQSVAERGLLWLTKFGMASLTADPPAPPE